MAILIPLALAGCCGGYSVVRTTVLSGVDATPGASDEVQRGRAFLLKYSRLGEPPNACGSGTQYLENLSIRVPTMRPGDTHSIGKAGVAATYFREQANEIVRASAIKGSIRINAIEGAEVKADLVVTITLPSGETVDLDDEYEFHPDTPR